MSRLCKAMAVYSILVMGCATGYAAEPQQAVYYKVTFAKGKAVLTRSTESPAVPKVGTYFYLPDENSSILLNGAELRGPGLFDAMTGAKVEDGTLVDLVEKEVELRQLAFIDQSLQETDSISCSSGNCT